MKVLILGCGWVGAAFARYCRTLGAHITATTTRTEKMKNLQSIADRVVLVEFGGGHTVDISIYDDYDFVLNSVSVGRGSVLSDVERKYSEIAELLQSISYRKHIYLSSIGIYPRAEAVYDESYDLSKGADPVLKQAEDCLSILPDTYILRLGGLFGEERIFAKYFSGKLCTTGGEAANFIHQEDVVRLIYLSFTHTLESSVYNLVCPVHPLKKEVIEASARKYNFELPSGYESQNTVQKIVKGTLLADSLGYKYIYENPIDF